MKYQNKHKSSRDKRANNPSPETHSIESKSDGSKRRILKNREEQESPNGKRVSPEAHDTQDRHFKKRRK